MSCYSITESHILQRRKDEFCFPIFWLDTTLLLNTANAGTERFVAVPQNHPAIHWQKWHKTVRTVRSQDFGVFAASAAVLFPHHTAFLFVVVVWVGGFWLLGELWSSILSGCLMEQTASIHNFKGSKGGWWRFLCQTGGTGMKLRDYSLRRFIEKANWKGKEKILANNSCLSPGSPSQGLHFLISRLQFYRSFFHCFSPQL